MAEAAETIQTFISPEAIGPQLFAVESWPDGLEISLPLRGHLRLVKAVPDVANLSPAIEVIEPERPLIVSVAELESDKLTRERAARFIGEVMASRAVVESGKLKYEKPINSLRDGIHWAAKGDADGLNMVDTCVATEMGELTYKTGHVTDPVPLPVTPDGKIIQYNQLGDSVQTNSLQLAADDVVLGPRTKAEATNHFRREDLYREDWYEEYSELVISMAEADDRFFTETMSCSLQLTSKATGGLQLETAFAAGVANRGEERHDLDTIIVLGDMIGIDFRGMTPAEIINTPILIHNSLIPKGAIDVVEKFWDKAASKVTGQQMFFGEAKPAPCSYAEYLQLCRERTKTFRPRVELVRNQLIREKDQIVTRVQAIERLHELSEAQMVEKAVEDHSIDPRAFGPQAAAAIESARAARAAGDMRAVQRFTKAAQTVADSKSCPWVNKKRKKNGELDLPGDDFEEQDVNEELESDEDCEFISEECPECHAKRVKTIVKSLGKGRGKLVEGSCGCKKKYPPMSAKAA